MIRIGVTKKGFQMRVYIKYLIIYSQIEETADKRVLVTGDGLILIEMQQDVQSMIYLSYLLHKLHNQEVDR